MSGPDAAFIAGQIATIWWSKEIVMRRASYRTRLVESMLKEYLRQLPALLVVGPRACGKSTTLTRWVKTVVRLDVEAEAAAFRADPDAALAVFEEPVLL